MSTVLQNFSATETDYERQQRERLRERLTYLSQHIPQSVLSASIQKTRAWMQEQKASVKLLNGKKCTSVELQAAINKLEAFE